MSSLRHYGLRVAYSDRFQYRLLRVLLTATVVAAFAVAFARLLLL